MVDALDECSDVEGLLPFITKISKYMRVLVTSRDEKSIRLALEDFPTVRMDVETVETDIRTFVEAKVQKNIANKRLLVGDVSLVDHIITTLSTRADGM